ncbi:DUF4232 domain-containing protein [Streptomyces sp. NPDC005813]|uniref:DUF4232 domain-containing protein n=1 Tax=Streptomyces sp. NPDC005813 TaxID=3155592 RepID=UPI0033E0E299
MNAAARKHHKSLRGWKPYVLGAAAMAALLASTACDPDEVEGSNDSKPSAGTSATSSAGASTPGSAEPGNGSSKPSDGSNATGGGDGDSGADDAVAACAQDDLSTSTTSQDEDSTTVRHLLLTVTNAGDKRCAVYHYPYVQLGADAQAPVAVIEDSDPEEPTVLAPGDEAHAALLVSGGARDTYEAKTITLDLQGPELGSHAIGPIGFDLPGVDSLTVDDGARVTYWTTASGYALDFIMSL